MDTTDEGQLELREVWLPVVPWQQLCSSEDTSRSAINGPLWTGPLHDAAMADAMRAEAAELGWTGLSTKGSSIKAGSQLRLEDLLSLLVAEASPTLLPGYVKLDAVAKWGALSGPPPRSALVSELQSRGFKACSCHLEPRAIWTSATFSKVVEVSQGFGGQQLVPPA
ncbi:hypothetical protein WJX84_011456 [Apatococcus fuscideae]|uniref:Uncharacterized protein n=1 Tax=Apatococcus fuscideae TaxID=2026836 RepID=A0AAW1SMQ4_9CHLO